MFLPRGLRVFISLAGTTPLKKIMVKSTLNLLTLGASRWTLPVFFQSLFIDPRGPLGGLRVVARMYISHWNQWIFSYLPRTHEHLSSSVKQGVLFSVLYCRSLVSLVTIISENISRNFFCSSPFTLWSPSIGMILMTLLFSLNTSPYTPSPIFLQFFRALKCERSDKLRRK